jgi:hypothetical protein
VRASGWVFALGVEVVEEWKNVYLLPLVVRLVAPSCAWNCYISIIASVKATFERRLGVAHFGENNQ